MIREILSGLIWQARVALRSGSARAFAAHGYVDEAYRPPRVPFVSVVGPLGLHPEPERENKRVAAATVKVPGHVIGKPRASTDSVPPAGALTLRFDGRATVTLTGLPGGSFGSAATGPAIAAAINAGLAAALAGGQFKEPSGATLTDPLLLAALAQATCRWDAEGARIALSSDPGIPSMENRSSVELLAVTDNIAGALGLAPPDVAQEGRSYLSRLTAPRAMTVDVRVDLWAASQGELAAMMDTVAAAAPTRGQLLLRPSLLAADAANGDTTIRLLARGEPTTGQSLAHLEATDQTLERARGGRLALTAGASWLAPPAGLQLSGTGTASVAVYPTPPVPDPMRYDNPAPRGLALALGLKLAAGSADGQQLRLVSLDAGGQPVIRIELGIVLVETALLGELVATATLSQGAGTATAQTRWRVPVGTLEAGVALHARVDGEQGVVWLSLDGQAQPLDDTDATPVPPTVAPGEPVAAGDMTLTLGNGAGNPVAFTVESLHLVAEPVGPLDPALRSSITPAARLRPGDVIVLADSDDGYRAGKRRFQALALSVNGDEVTLSRPVEGSWPRGRTLAFQDECFFFQTQLRRKDDLLNHLYRCSVDYRVSGLLEDPNARPTAPLVEKPVVELVPRGASRVAGGHPGTAVVDVDTAKRGVI